MQATSLGVSGGGPPRAVTLPLRPDDSIVHSAGGLFRQGQYDGGTSMPGDAPMLSTTLLTIADLDRVRAGLDLYARLSTDLRPHHPGVGRSSSAKLVS